MLRIKLNLRGHARIRRVCPKLKFRFGAGWVITPQGDAIAYVAPEHAKVGTRARPDAVAVAKHFECVGGVRRTNHMRMRRQASGTQHLHHRIALGRGHLNHRTGLF